MSAVETKVPSNISAPDSGGRGPHSKLPTGGGGDGEWNRQPTPDPRDRLKRARVALAVLMTTSVALFATLSIGYLCLRRGQTVFDRVTQTYIPVWKPISIPRLLWWNTLLLVLSSVALELARREYFRDEALMEEWLGITRSALRRAFPWQVLGIAFAVGFIAGQLDAWTKLRAQGVFLGSGPSSQFYYFLTGLHGLHLLGGIVVLILCMIAGFAGQRVDSRRVMVDITAWYWHAITVVWFGLFALLKASA
ncbi:MAG: heme-copper oxidase subunit III [Acidobacteria bacterium]|nr:MAG: heme-copper oxidase subunit III [Acidobacteriota bacterium]PYY19851.1 MAG: heme-copper oxidase subunit III [Acidobacteriota bacterium]